ncbi:MAG: NAD(P)/FAD-dependent oxidoreductase [SAR324 cluster bacterium]|nr:NAD(P)/FAD-dependent oxidoreductase [SAR324 cluster bacterium]MBL7035179.1 NAD(P)/FAD-dependent oxidoreductase [SAR324 cluster bacterium]
MQKYDLCIIGGGPSGYAAAMRAVDFNKTVILVERDRLGGAGIYDGALSSKTFWEISKEYASFSKKMLHYGLSEPDIHFHNVLQEVNDAVFERSHQLEEHLQLVIQRSNAAFRFVKGSGRLHSSNQIELDTDSGKELVFAENIIIATGSRPRKIPTIKVDEKFIMSSDGISSLEEFPESLVILGAGVIGCEFATIFSNFQKTKVHLICKDDRILPFEDTDLAQVIEINLESNGVIIHRESKLEKMEVVAGKVEYLLEHADGKKEVFQAEKALVSIGRIPNIENTGLHELGVDLSAAGHIVDNDTQTSISNIFAVGDITADIALVNVGELEGRHAVEKIYGKPKRPMIYENISTIMFLNPEVAGVGMNEQQAQKAGLNYRVASFDFRCIPRAVAMRNTQGFFKILVTDDSHMKVLGMRAVGEHASSAIQGVALLIATDKGIEELAELIHPHPSIIEGIQECIRMLLGKSIYKPYIFNEFLQYKCFRDGQYID